eukprot:CAMPEP_0117550422 /NCGR_PEP_ID=MMETSP0784-20121206/48673_1 /TAXON_ID=39447 /ORGANISM="" /LENGTH=143 /DNA_ID=CAMNT_0005347441 /DNA_START=20 /DNA_END=447 /DNA_ORIENTATION=+
MDLSSHCTTSVHKGAVPTVLCLVVLALLRTVNADPNKLGDALDGCDYAVDLGQDTNEWLTEAVACLACLVAPVAIRKAWKQFRPAVFKQAQATSSSLQVIAASLLKKVGFVHWVVLRGMLLPRALHHALAVLSAIGHAVCRPP